MCPNLTILLLQSCWLVLAARAKSLMDQGSRSVQPGVALELVNAVQLDMTRLSGRAT